MALQVLHTLISFGSDLVMSGEMLYDESIKQTNAVYPDLKYVFSNVKILILYILRTRTQCNEMGLNLR